MLFPVAGIELHPLVPPAIGFGVGVLSGVFGVGGGFLVAPILMWIGVPPVRAVGSGLNQIVASSSSGALLKARLGDVSARLGLLVAAGGVPAALAGTLVVERLIDTGAFDPFVKAAYALLLVVIGARMARELVRRGAGTASSGTMPVARSARRRDAGAVALGAAAGLLSAFLGVGGGVILVPAMIYLLRVPTRTAVGTSLLQILCISFAATVFHAGANRDVDVVLAALLMAGSIPGSWVGVWLCRRLGTRSLRGLFGVLVLAAAGRMAYGLATGGGGRSGHDLPDRALFGPFLARIQALAVDHPVLYGLAAAGFALAAGSVLALAVRGVVCPGDDPRGGGETARGATECPR